MEKRGASPPAALPAACEQASSEGAGGVEELPDRQRRAQGDHGLGVRGHDDVFPPQLEPLCEDPDQLGVEGEGAAQGHIAAQLDEGGQVVGAQVKAVQYAAGCWQPFRAQYLQGV